MLRIPERGRHITQEPQIIAADLVGAPLATFRRRTIAIAIDTAAGHGPSKTKTAPTG